MIPFASVQGLGGGMELGIIQSGSFELVHRTGGLDLGAPLVEQNRKLYGWNWTSNFTSNQRKWQQVDVAFVSSNAPCSAFSTLTSKTLRGTSAKVLQYTDEVFDFVAMQKKTPLLVSIESVQQAFSLGRPYFQQKRLELEEKTGKQWDLIWVFQSNQSLGGASVRRRVFITLSQIPFGVEYAQPARIARFGDAVRDLQGLELTTTLQPYRRPSTWWSTSRRAADGVDGHFNDPRWNNEFAELIAMSDAMGQRWAAGESLETVLRRVWAHYQRLPHEWQRNVHKHEPRNFGMGINQTSCWDPDALGRVVTGAGPMMSVHWAEPRLLTYREVFRLQGFPDTYRLYGSRDYKKASTVAGKGVPVDAGRWLGEWVGKAFNGEPGTILGEKIGDRERKIDLTHAWKNTYEFEAPWRYAKHSLHEQIGNPDWDHMQHTA
jgi:site-specific DNA-cytosine methylase